MSKDGLKTEAVSDQEVETLLVGFIEALILEQEKHRATQVPEESS